MATTVQGLTLPETLPVFPLTGVLLLPGTLLPLHVFEPRYRHLVEDALERDSLFGMIQPFVPQQDNRPLPGAERLRPDLYKVGCAGHIEQWEKLPDGRFLIQLRGIHRFRVTDELPLSRGYRRVRAEYVGFTDSPLPGEWHGNRAALLEALSGYGSAHGMQVRSEQAHRFSDFELVNLIAVSIPFHPAEKQALLEAPTLADRERLLIDLLRLGAGAAEDDSEPSARTLN